MNANFKAKFLQNFVSKKKGNEGFTLIELLVVIIIVGVLAAIALPSFLNQIGKARGSEAKSSIGTINRSQQAYRLENSLFASNLGDLDAKITGKFYTYTVTPAATATTSAVTTAVTAGNSGLKVSYGSTNQTGDVFKQQICESKDTAAASIAATGALVACDGAYTQVQ